MTSQGQQNDGQFLRHLATAVSTAKLYSEQHTQVKKLCQMARTNVLAAMSDKNSVSLLRVDEQLALDEQPLDRTLYNTRFALLLKRSGIGYLKILRNVSTEEIQTLVGNLTGRSQVISSSENIRLGQVEVRHRRKPGKSGLQSPPLPTSPEESRTNTRGGIIAKQTEASTGLKKPAADGKQSIAVRKILEDISSEELARVMEIYEAVQNNRQLHVVGLSEIVTGFINVFTEHADPLLTLVPLRNMDEYTFTHSLNVCLLNLAQATALGIKGEVLHDIGLSAMLHDVGKLFVPEEVLNKPGKLEEKEWNLIQEHPVRGAEYLLNNPGVPRMAVINAYEHHLRFDLRGYPRVKPRWQQNLCSQLTSISDIYDSLRTKRPYREPTELSVVLETIESLKGTQLHPLLVENFLCLIRKVSPPGERQF